MPEKSETCGFPAFYHDCYHRRMRTLLVANGFQVVRLQPTFYQSRYYDFFCPLFLLTALYEMFVASLGLNDLSAYLVVVARKDPDRRVDGCVK